MSSRPQALDEGGVERFDGASTKCGRRRRRETDRRSNNARVRHSYFKIVLDDLVFDQLHGLMCEVGREWNNENIIDAGRPPTTSKKQSKRRLTLRPRSRTSLHMTYFFAGKALEDMPGEELLRWEHFVRKCVSEHDSHVMPGDHSLRFKSLRLFPPHRQNLIVAMFEPSAALNDLYDKLCGIAAMKKEESRENTVPGDATVTSAPDGAVQDYEFPLLRDLTRKQHRGRRQESRWIAHVTLGRLAGGKAGDARSLREWLEAVQRADDGVGGDAGHETAAIAPKISSRSEALSLVDMPVSGLALGGPVPEHVTDDWNFPFKRQK